MRFLLNLFVNNDQLKDQGYISSGVELKFHNPIILIQNFKENFIQTIVLACTKNAMLWLEWDKVNQLFSNWCEIISGGEYDYFTSIIPIDHERFFVHGKKGLQQYQCHFSINGKFLEATLINEFNYNTNADVNKAVQVPNISGVFFFECRDKNTYLIDSRHQSVNINPINLGSIGLVIKCLEITKNTYDFVTHRNEKLMTRWKFILGDIQLKKICDFSTNKNFSILRNYIINIDYGNKLCLYNKETGLLLEKHTLKIFQHENCADRLICIAVDPLRKGIFVVTDSGKLFYFTIAEDNSISLATSFGCITGNSYLPNEIYIRGDNLIITSYNVIHSVDLRNRTTCHLLNRSSSSVPVWTHLDENHIFIAPGNKKGALVKKHNSKPINYSRIMMDIFLLLAEVNIDAEKFRKSRKNNTPLSRFLSDHLFDKNLLGNLGIRRFLFQTPNNCINLDQEKQAEIEEEKIFSIE